MILSVKNKIINKKLIWKWVQSFETTQLNAEMPVTKAVNFFTQAFVGLSISTKSFDIESLSESFFTSI